MALSTWHLAFGHSGSSRISAIAFKGQALSAKCRFLDAILKRPHDPLPPPIRSSHDQASDL
ncbi:hypothetical protein SBA7_100028 [Candidatus Sulfotelmatobacter sp. SbA7]|nr:hypothetical protein SBA7_100028 [Candidatus Sulfotelmatobacter sp. SbA7]